VEAKSRGERGEGEEGRCPGPEVQRDPTLGKGCARAESRGGR